MFKILAFFTKIMLFCVYLLIRKRAGLRMVIGNWLLVTGYW